MNTITKTLLGGAALLAAGGAGAFYVNNHVIPAHLAEGLNATFDDMEQTEALDGTGLTVAKDGLITVEPRGILTYTVTTPAITVSGEGTEEQPAMTAVIDATPYELTFYAPSTSVTPFMPWGLWDETQPVSVTLESLGPTGFSVDMPGIFTEEKIVAQDGNISVTTTTADMTADGICETSGYHISLQGGELSSLARNFSGCDFTAEITDNDLLTATVQGTMAITDNLDRGMVEPYFASNFIMLSEPGFVSGFTRVTVSDLHGLFPHAETGVIDMSITADLIEFITLWGRMPQESWGKSPSEWTPADIPDYISSEFFVTNLSVTDLTEAEPVLPTISLSSAFHAGDLHTDDALAGIGFDLLIGGDADAPAHILLCDADIDGIPAQQFAQATIDNIGEYGPLHIGPDYEHPVDPTGLTARFACDLFQDGVYTVTAEASHEVTAETFPGSGRIEAYGVEKALEALVAVDRNLAQGIAILGVLAKPTEDGKGLALDYAIDEAGNVTANGQAVGVPVMRP